MTRHVDLQNHGIEFMKTHERISRATLYERIREGLITTQKDGRRTFSTAAELQRYVIPGS